MPRYKLGPRLGLTEVPPIDVPPAGKVDQGVGFAGVDEGVALFDLTPYDPATIQPIVGIHLCFVRPPVPDSADAAYFLAESSEIVRSFVPVVPDSGSSRVGVALPVLAPGTWDGRSVLEYAE